MIIIFKSSASRRNIQELKKRLSDLGLQARVSTGNARITMSIIGDIDKVSAEQLRSLACVDGVIRVTKPYKLAGRDFRPRGTVIRVEKVRVGGPELVVVAGPCDVESEKQLLTAARAVKAHGGNILRAAVFKPRSSPYEFQGDRKSVV
jgi:3-deoxy-7-phosphoheptulonate synthase